jgi:cold shock CspA family protein
MSSERKTGSVYFWKEGRGFGFVRVGDRGSLEKYFLMSKDIRSGTAEPEIGMTLTFEIGEAARKEGELPRAVRADVVMESIPKKAIAEVK